MNCFDYEDGMDTAGKPIILNWFDERINELKGGLE